MFQFLVCHIWYYSPTSLEILKNNLKSWPSKKTPNTSQPITRASYHSFAPICFSVSSFILFLLIIFFLFFFKNTLFNLFSSMHGMEFSSNYNTTNKREQKIEKETVMVSSGCCCCCFSSSWPLQLHHW